ncbi:MAG: ABC transporter ATP-binding protein [Anaerolineaceae bacterium]|nr:ABC transporter ATP-binding protein [Anaerolineaceae bacterium]
MSEELAIETHQLRKEFGSKVAVQNLSLTVRRGEVFGFLGPNGAGKTTVVKILLGLAAPTSGHAKLLGTPLGDRAARAKTGFLPEHFRFPEWLTGEEFLRFNGRLFGIPAQQLQGRILRLLELVGLTDYGKQKLQTYSKGMLQRIGLAQALINEPELVFLDEPTSGLDPVGRLLVRDIIRDLSAKGKTVFLNSHLLSEVEITCDRVAFIKHGQVIQTSPLKDLMLEGTRLEIRGDGLSADIVSGLASFGRDIHADGSKVRITVSEKDGIAEITCYLVQKEVNVYAMNTAVPSLEDLFLSIIGTDGGL